MGFSLFIAPPAFGKTRILFEIYRELSCRMIFVSPLRALANEFHEKALKEVKGALLVQASSEKKEIFKKFFEKEKALLVVTPEMLDSDFIEGLTDELVILDEFHLYYYWGQGFRPLLFEMAMALASSGVSILGLTATMSQDFILKWQHDFSHEYDELTVIDFGNQRLKTLPQKTHHFFNKKIFRRLFIHELLKNNKEECFLYFCEFRHEVDHWMDFCKRRGIEALGCKGGEVITFIEEKKKNPRPRCIFATTALSHGVNLPSVSKVFIGYKLSNLDYWIQMAGRGGRQGESYELYTFDNFGSTLLQRSLNHLKVLSNDALIKTKLYFCMDI